MRQYIIYIISVLSIKKRFIIVKIIDIKVSKIMVPVKILQFNRTGTIFTSFNSV